MFKFEDERITEFEIKNEKFKFPIPAICIKPKEITDSSVIFVFNSGLASTNSIIKYMNYFIYDKNWLISYEKAGHGANKNKPSQFKYLPLRELDVLVDWIRANYPGRRIYLLGESWGSQINMVYYKKHKDKVAGMINWNAPFHIKDSEKRSAKFMFEVAFKHIATFLFNKTFIISKNQSDTTAVTNNLVLQRALMLQGDIKNNTKATINVWRYMLASYRFMKRYGKNPDYNFLYVQSGNDALEDKKKTYKLSDKYCDQDHMVRVASGKHILSFEPNEAETLYKIIENFINKK